ncbi:MAG: 23S rRNA (guanosine(2251)-2'-O)-methyltransferase RlmB [Acutalibacteraceae bacterium]
MPLNDIQSDIIAGRNAVFEAVRSGREIEYVMIAKGVGGAATPIIAECKKRGIVIKEMPRNKLDLKLGGMNHQGVAAVVSSAEYSTIEDIIEKAKTATHPLILVLDEIEDPHNLGAIIRSAEAAGAVGLIIPKRRSAGLNRTVAKVASGALEYLPVARVSNIAAAVEKLKSEGFWAYGADMDGECVYDVDMSGKTALIIGSEGHGISRIVREKCDVIVSIPMFGNINSLNASVAAGILIYETVRRNIQNS